MLGQHSTVHLMNIPNHMIGCISKTLRQAIMIVAITLKLFLSHRRAPEFRFSVKRATKIAVIGPDGSERTMEAYPGNPDVRRSSFFFSLCACKSVRVRDTPLPFSSFREKRIREAI
jgi:hypothetical protein